MTAYHDRATGFHPGQTALVVHVPEAEPAVRSWRARYDPAARAGVPAHVTVLFPFLDESRLDEPTVEALAGIFGARPAFDARFEGCARFPGVLYLAPDPAAPFRRLTEDIVARWPETPPYGGKFAGIVPHLTVADGHEDHVLDEIEAGLSGELPVASRIGSVDLVAYDGTAWRRRRTFALGRP
ncbi:2'-5' RNA ligase family protein [Streptomyces sp. NPDC004610]|uniref:2'-5' RNA ligase family protein n=1 Tax=unclassified Streptomyces TaxID=2593676 RepID=UPI0033B2CF6B